MQNKTVIIEQVGDYYIVQQFIEQHLPEKQVLTKEQLKKLLTIWLYPFLDERE